MSAATVCFLCCIRVLYRCALRRAPMRELPTFHKSGGDGSEALPPAFALGGAGGSGRRITPHAQYTQSHHRIQHIQHTFRLSSF